MATFSEDQQLAFEAFQNDENVFVSGPGGSGKSFLIKEIVKECKKKGKRVTVCAMTGCAALLLECNATTIHSWSGIGLAKSEDHQIIFRASMNKFIRNRWKKTDVLILDEVSMLSKRIFDLLNEMGKNMRNSLKPFGGIQLVLSGDFCQLAPIPTKGDPDSDKFCFESESWSSVFDSQILLDKIFRQSDPVYLDLLYQVRQGNINKKNYELLKSRTFNELPKEEKEDKIVKLVSTRREADFLNSKMMTAIEGEKHVFRYKVSYEPANNTLMSIEDRSLTITKPSKAQLTNEEKFITSNSMFESDLTVKLGARMMCVRNIDLEKGICNGTIGTVNEIDEHKQTIKMEFDNGTEYTFGLYDFESPSIAGFSIKQFPLIPAWAVTIHKSQGATLEKAYMNLGNSIFAYGQIYVALSRVKSIQGLFLSSFDPCKIKTNPKITAFYEQFYE